MTQPTALRKPGEIILLAVWFGILTGLFEVTILIIRRFALDRLIWTSMDMIWWAPLVYGGFFVIPGFPLAALARLFPNLVTLSRVTFLLGFLAVGVVALTLFGGSIHPLAQLLIAAGIATQLARWVARSGTRIVTLARSAVWLMGAVALTASAVPAGRRLIQIRADAARPTAPAGARNILLIIWDTVRAEELSLHGYPLPTTPNLERIGEQGVVFDRALSTAPWTLSSHASMFTGRLTQELSTTWHTPLDESFPTIAEVLSRQGFRTGGFVANLVATTRESGLDRGFAHYADYQFRPSQIVLSTTVGQRIRRLRPFNRGPLRMYAFKSAEQVTDEFLQWVEQDRTRPFFGFLNYFDAHDPYYPPAEWRRRFPAPGPDRVQRIQAAYDGAIGYLDSELDRMRRELEHRGLWDNTLVIITSDHGELFGEHGLFQHGNSLYLPLLHVPLVMRLPGSVPSGRRIAQPVGQADLPATVVSLARANPDFIFPGRSLEWAWQDAQSFPDTLISGVPQGIGTPPEEPVTLGDMSSVFAGRLHYILNGDGSEQLFDVESDPVELRNLVSDSTSDLTIGTFRAALLSRVPARWTRAITPPASPGSSTGRSGPER